MTPCRAVKVNGEPCKAVQGLVDGLCQAHDPARAAEAQARRVRGGKNAHGRPNLPTEQMPALVTLEDCDTVASWIVTQLATGALDARVADSMTRALTQKRLTLYNVQDVERRLKDFKKRLAEVQKGDPRA